LLNCCNILLTNKEQLNSYIYKLYFKFYIKRNNFIISNILYNKIKKFFFVNLIKYNSNTITIAQYFIEQIIVNIVVVVAIRVVFFFVFTCYTIVL